jgi:multiple sugar transport system ATP-binding protein
MARIEFKDVTVRYGSSERPRAVNDPSAAGRAPARHGRTDAVHKVSLAVADGRYCCLLGPSGCGKTSLLRALAGFVPVAAGDILVDGERVNTVYPGDRGLAMIFQNFALYPHLTVRENFAFPLRAAKIPEPQIPAAVAKVAERLGMTDLLDRYPRELSGGQQQRVAIGRALVRTPRAFLLDEPLGNLDAKLKVSMRTYLRQLHDELKATFIHVTHDQTEALALADLIVVMNAGRIEQAGTPQELYDRPATVFVAGFVGSPPMNLIEGAIDEAALVSTFRSGGIEADVSGVPGARKGRGRRLVLGVRPEDLLVGRDATRGIRARVAVVEFAGKECVLDLAVNHHLIRARVARESLGDPVAPGADLALLLPPDRLHLFDADSGSRLD